jgi:cytochrome c oxidase subunit 2
MIRYVIMASTFRLCLGLVACSTETVQEPPEQDPANPPAEPPVEEDPEPERPPEAPIEGNQPGGNQPQGSTAQTPGDENQSSNEANDTQVIEVEAYQFGWDPNPIRVEAGRPVRLELSSRDVSHGIGIPELGVSEQIPASGETVTAEFTPEEPGEYNFICNVYCGQGHSAMTGTLIVE